MLHPKLSRIGFGGAALSGEGGGYGFGLMTEKEAEALLKTAWESSITVFDTAPIYGFGLSEERLGKFLPKEAFIITKGGVDWHDNGRVNMSNDPAIIEKMLLQSLERLRREQIDLYMIHWPDPRVDIRKPLEVLKKYQDQGVIKAIGLCNTTTSDLKHASEVADIWALQSELNLFQTQSFDELGSLSTYFTMGWGTFDKGILTGRVHEDRKFDKEDARSWAPWWNKKEVFRKIEKVKKLKAILDQYDISLKKFNLHFSLYHYELSSCLVGSKTATDLKEVVDLAQTAIPQDLFDSVMKAWANS
jgi:myo-inositol catabolism protein IolS